MKIPSILTLLISAVILSSCNESKVEDNAQNSSTQIAAFYVEEAPANAVEISEAMTNPVAGQEVVISGEVMGRMHPFVESRAMVMLGDPTRITPCNRIPGDECPTPWDTCCDDPEVLIKSISTIQFKDATGGIIKEGLRGFKGIKELSFLTVKGVIAEGSNPNNLLIDALSFHITEPSPYLNAPPAADYSHHGHMDGKIQETDGEFIYVKPEQG